MKLLLVGIGPGNGISIARRFGREGFEILMVARNEDKLNSYVAELAQAGIKSQAYAADIADSESFVQVLERIVSEHPDIEVLHYNASSYNPATPSQLELSVLLSDLNINVVGALLSAQAVFPQMKERGHGTLFFTGGGTAIQAPAFLASLGMGKAAMRNLVFSIAQEGLPLGIHASTVTITGMVKAGTRFDPDLIADEFWRLYELPRDRWETEVVW
ncbi:MAG: SDR family NAD(P)-dependent oxidoreductase [Bacteroidetes bacterium]|nr:SDR family NAD(P)-dependent oxidoreductase [Bacteroidota bacterium]